MDKTVLRIPLTVNENDLTGGAKKILEIIRPKWILPDIEFKLLTDGITNKLVACKPADADIEETVLIRIYGNKTDLLIDRKAETRNIILLTRMGLAPALYATFENGLSYQFVPGVTLTPESVKDSKIYKLVAQTMAKLHKVKNGQVNPEPMVWQKLERFLNLVPDTFSDNNKHKRYQELLIPKEKIREEVNGLKNVLLNIDSPVVFAHNDLLLGNVIYTEEKNCVTFIDYEYAAYNYQAFDIADHFTEFVGIDSDNIDYEANYPKEDFQKEWLKAYLQEYEGDFSQKNLEKLYVQVNQFALLTHVFWGVWALIQAEHSYIDFDFIRYAAIRFNEYFKKKEKCLSMKLPE